MESVKKQKTAESSPQRRRVFLSPSLDEPEKLVQVDLSLLQNYPNSRILKQILYDDPLVEKDTLREYYSVTMTKAMLQTFIRSLTHGELTMSKNVTVAEAYATFEYENIVIGIPQTKVGETSLDRAVRSTREGVCYEKRIDSVRDVIVRTCEQVAEAISRWPLLEDTLESVLQGSFASHGYSATRGWIRFCCKPSNAHGESSGGSDTILKLAAEWPPWLRNILYAVACVHLELSGDGVIDGKARTEETFVKIQNHIQSDVLGPYFAIRYDQSLYTKDGKARSRHVKASRFVNEMRTTVVEGADAPLMEAKMKASREGTDRPEKKWAGQEQVSNLAFGAPALPNVHNVPNVPVSATPANVQLAGASESPAQENQPTITASLGLISLGGGPLAKPEDAIKFARGWLGFAENMLFRCPNLSQLFSGRVLDESKTSFERTQLSKSLLQRGIRVVRWEDSLEISPESRAFTHDSKQKQDAEIVISPLIFPSAFKAVPDAKGNRWAGVLLDYSGVR